MLVAPRHDLLSSQIGSVLVSVLVLLTFECEFLDFLKVVKQPRENRMVEILKGIGISIDRGVVHSKSSCDEGGISNGTSEDIEWLVRFVVGYGHGTTCRLYERINVGWRVLLIV